MRETKSDSPVKCSAMLNGEAARRPILFFIKPRGQLLGSVRVSSRNLSPDRQCPRQYLYWIERLHQLLASIGEASQSLSLFQSETNVVVKK